MVRFSWLVRLIGEFQVVNRMVPRRNGTPDASAMPQMVEMGDGLAHREKALLQVEFAPKQHRQHVGGADRRCGGGDGLLEFRQTGGVMRVQLRHAQRDAAKRQAMRRQHQRFRRQPRDSRERVEKARQRIAIRLGRPRRSHWC